eukprot:TRINITY_DN1916_c0_g1_i2.p1 TRINITY_DN1916_c0_g1~~TRINITY_DN1916_c0_g1_i2.p1  ORF type:complete len:404 (+),score=53.01 TRINITY_DN1916_c0_g1_i2:239-1450(+)
MLPNKLSSFHYLTSQWEIYHFYSLFVDAKSFWDKIGESISDTLAKTTPGLPSGLAGFPVFDDRKEHLANVIQPAFVNLPNRANIEKMYHFAAMLVQDRMMNELVAAAKEPESKHLMHLNTLANIDTIVINPSQFNDAVGRVLGLAKIPHKTIKLGEVPDFPFSPHQTIFLSCTTDNIPDPAVNTLKRFVKAGGQLCVSDYLLEHLIAKAWPEYMDVNDQIFDKTPPQDKHVFVTVPQSCSDMRVLSVFQDEPDKLVSWCVSKKSVCVVVKDETKVNRLLVSAADQKYGLVYHFFYGAGQVYYSLPHFYTHDSYNEPPYMHSKQRIYEYILNKGGGPKLLQEVDEYLLKKDDPTDMRLTVFRSIVTSLEFILRVLLRQKQVTPGPVSLVPPDWVAPRSDMFSPK